MLDEGSLRRLAEMGIDAYTPRVAARAKARADDVTDSVAGEAMPAPPRAPGLYRVLLLADTKAPSANALTLQVRRGLKFAGFECVLADVAAESALSSVAALVVFGETLARQAGALLPAARQQAMGWVAAADAANIAGDAHAKRALWSELKRMMRTVKVSGHGVSDS